LVGPTEERPSTGERAAAAAGSRAPDVSIAATALVAQYSANEIAADQQFKEKTIAVGGVVESIANDILGSPYLILAADQQGFRNVQAVFARNKASELAAISKGQFVEVQCRCKGLMMNVQLDDCELKAVGQK
jgi:hypothetical protein